MAGQPNFAQQQLTSFSPNFNLSLQANTNFSLSFNYQQSSSNCYDRMMGTFCRNFQRNWNIYLSFFDKDSCCFSQAIYFDFWRIEFLRSFRNGPQMKRLLPSLKYPYFGFISYFQTRLFLARSSRAVFILYLALLWYCFLSASSRLYLRCISSLYLRISAIFLFLAQISSQYFLLTPQLAFFDKDQLPILPIFHNQVSLTCLPLLSQSSLLGADSFETVLFRFFFIFDANSGSFTLYYDDDYFGIAYFLGASAWDEISEVVQFDILGCWFV